MCPWWVFASAGPALCHQPRSLRSDSAPALSFDRHAGRSPDFPPTQTDYEIATGAAKNLCISLGARRCGIPDQAERCAIALV